MHFQGCILDIFPTHYKTSLVSPESVYNIYIITTVILLILLLSIMRKEGTILQNINNLFHLVIYIR